MATDNDDLLPIPRRVLDWVRGVLGKGGHDDLDDAERVLDAAIRDAKAVEARAAADWREILRRWPRADGDDEMLL